MYLLHLYLCIVEHEELIDVEFSIGILVRNFEQGGQHLLLLLGFFLRSRRVPSQSVPELFLTKQLLERQLTVLRDGLNMNMRIILGLSMDTQYLVCV